jgi:hypothetical protein
MLEILGPVPKSLTACDTILKLGFTEKYNKNEIRVDNAMDIAPTIPKYPPLSWKNFMIRFFIRLRIIVVVVISIKISTDMYLNFLSIFKIELISDEQ